jgi:DNA repair protein SbcC/Rad50
LRPLEIKIKNYKSYGEEETQLDLSGNSVKLIYGNIGAGKTTFVDAIIWCLYGQSLVNQDEVVNRKTKKNCKVEFSFFIKEDLYSITRYRNHEVNKDNLLIFKNHKNISPNKKRDAQDLINEIVGINHKAMINSVMFSSEIYTSFLRVPEGKRLEIIESVLNLKQFQRWGDVIKKLKKPLEEETQILKEEKNKLEYGIETINNNITEYKENAKTILEGLKKEKEFLEEEKKSLLKEIEENKDIDVNKEIELINKNKEIKDFNKEIENKIKELKQNRDEIKKDFNIKNKEYNEILEKIKNIEEINFTKELENINKENKDKLARERINELTKQKEDISSLNKRIKDLNLEIENLEEELNKTSDNVCYTCGQLINKELKEKIEKDLNDKKKLNKEKEDKLNKEKNKVIEKNKELDKKIEELKKGLYEVSSTYTEEEIEGLRTSHSSLKIKEAGLKELVISLNDKLENKNKEIKKQEKLLKPIESIEKYSLEFLENLGEQNKNKEEKINIIFNKLETINEKAKNTYDKKYIEGLNKKIKQIKKEQEKQINILLKKEEEIKQHNLLLSVFSNKDFGIKKYIISKMINLFNNNINKYIPLFFDRRIDITFDKNLTASILENEEEISFQSFSSGEKTLLDVAIAFSLYMLVKSFFSSDIRFLIFDEILDRNLDETGINAILNIIEEKAKSNSIMVISHRGEYKESFTNKIRVYKEDGFSKLAYE